MHTTQPNGRFVLVPHANLRRVDVDEHTLASVSTTTTRKGPAACLGTGTIRSSPVMGSQTASSSFTRSSSSQTIPYRAQGRGSGGRKAGERGGRDEAEDVRLLVVEVLEEAQHGGSTAEALAGECGTTACRRALAGSAGGKRKRISSPISGGGRRSRCWVGLGDVRGIGTTQRWERGG